jgi:hypothetical protein
VKNLLLLFVLLVSACAKPVYTVPTIGMSFMEFDSLCGFDIYDNRRTVTTADKETFTVATTDTPERQKKQCVGTFVFINNKLNSITR